MKKILVVAPHLDDETLGCGGTILRYKNKYKIEYALITRTIDEKYHKDRLKIIETISKIYNFKKVHQFNFITATLDHVIIPKLIEKFRKLDKENKYDIIFTPYLFDIHTDHQIVSQSVLSAFKSFRSSKKNKIFFYETISETNFAFKQFKPNKYIDISNQFLKKVEILNKFKQEILNHPFPRSIKSVKSLATLRGSESANSYAEAFYLFNDTTSDL